MLIIRLTRRGRRNDPSFRLVVTEHTNPVKGKFLEELGFLNPKTKAKSFKQERILYWLSQGVKLSPTVNNLLVSEKIIDRAKAKAWRPKKRAPVETPKTETKKEVKVEEKITEVLSPEKKEEAQAPASTEEVKTESVVTQVEEKKATEPTSAQES